MNHENFENMVAFNHADEMATKAYQNQDIPTAIYWSEIAVKLARNLFGSSSDELAITLGTLGLSYLHQCEYSKAESAHKEALEIRLKLFGVEPNSKVAYALNNLGLLYINLERWAEAEDFLKQALEMRLYLFADEPTEVLATSHQNLALLYQSQKWWQKAEPLYVRAIAIRRQVLGDNVNYGLLNAIGSLANIYKYLGRWQEAESLFQEQMVIIQQLSGGRVNNPLATTWHNLASLYHLQGRLQESEQYYLKALHICRQLFGNTPNRDLAITLNDLGAIYRSQFRFQEAENLFLESLEILKHLDGDRETNMLASSYSNLGVTYQALGRLDEAEELFEEASRIRQNFFDSNGEPNSYLSSDLNNLAFICRLKKRWEEAESFQLKSIEIQRLVAGEKGDIDLVSFLNNLATLYASTDRHLAALETFNEAIQIQNHLLLDYFSYATPENQSLLLEKMHASLGLIVSLVWQYLSDNPEAVAIAFDTIVKRKAASTVSMTLVNAAQYNDNYPHLRPQFDRWQVLKQEIATGSSYLEVNFLQQLKDECRQIYEQIASQVAEIKATSLAVDRQTISGCLDSDTILVEFFRLSVNNFTQLPQQNKYRYLAFIITSDLQTEPKMVDLGSADEMEELIYEYRELIAVTKVDRFVMVPDEDDEDDDNIPIMPIGKEIQREAEIGKRLFSVIFEPILPQIASTTNKLILAADGDLYRLPFAILPTNDRGERIIDLFQIETLTAARDLRRRYEKTFHPPTTPLIVADPDYECDVTESTGDLQMERLSIMANLTDTYGAKFNRLKMTRQLGNSIANRLNVNPYLDRAATELLFYSLKTSPKYLIVATHGFTPDSFNSRRKAFIEAILDRPESLTKTFREYQDLIDKDFHDSWAKAVISIGSVNSTLADYFRSVIPCLDEFIKTNEMTIDRDSPLERDPMNGSGIALAGANKWLKNQPLPAQFGKGVLLASDIAQLNLWGTELTIFVACSTALGEAKSGQGIFGLRRALALAGAKYAIVSLWDVPALASMLLMDFFFDAYDEGIDPHQALRQSQNRVRKISISELKRSSLGKDIIDELISSRMIHSHPHDDFQPLKSPYFWGAWICQG